MVRPGPKPKARRGDDFDVRMLDGRKGSYSYKVQESEAGLRLDHFLAKRLSWRSRASIRKLLDADMVSLPGRSARPSRKLVAGDVVTVRLPRPVRDEAYLASHPAPELPRLFEDDQLIAIDKPPNMPVHPAGRLLNHTVITELHRVYRDFEDPSRDVVPKLCHRLDLETSGVLLVAKRHEALVHVQQQFEKRTVRKEYLVLVRGEVEGEEGLIDLPLGPSLDSKVRNARGVRHDAGGQPARTGWRVLERWPGYTRCHIRLHTGRHHQIRVHMAAIGHPVVGDKLYGGEEELFLRHGRGELDEADRARLELPRQALHSHALVFDHPTRGELRLESPWPPDLVAFCAGLGAG